MPSLKRHPRYPAAGITWGESDAARFRVPRPRSSPAQVEPVRRSRRSPRSAWLAVEFILILFGAILLYWYLLIS